MKLDQRSARVVELKEVPFGHVFVLGGKETPYIRSDQLEGEHGSILAMSATGHVAKIMPDALVTHLPDATLVY